MKNIIKILTATICLFSNISLYAYTFVVDGIYYIERGNDKTVAVTYYNTAISNTYTGTVTIPKDVTYNGVTYSVTSIGAFAFNNCNGLTSITIPNSVTWIGVSAFSGCTGLKSLTIEDGDSELELVHNDSYEGLFYDCPIEILYIGRNLSYDTAPSYGYSPFCSINKLKSVTIGNSVTSIGEHAFYNCTGLTSVTIPNSVTSIGERAFYNCKGLKELTIPNSVTSIGTGAFQYCNKLTEVTIPNSVTSIGNYIFDNCSGLTKVTIPESVTSIGYDAFSGCYGLRVYCLPIVPPSISSSTFESSAIINLSFESLSKYIVANNWKSLKLRGVNNGITYYLTSTTTLEVVAGDTHYSGEVIIPESITHTEGVYTITSIGGSAFSGCTGLTEITIPNSVTSIGDYAFNKCTSLTDVTIPNSVTSIGESAFYLCTGLTTVNFNAENCTTMGYSSYPVFEGCSNLTTVNIGEAVKTIPDNAFRGCTGLTEVTIPNSVTSIGDYAFIDCTGLTTVNFNAENCTSMGSYSSPVFEGCSNLTTVNIGEAVKMIPNCAFYNCTGLTSVTIPNSVTSIGDYAFLSCTGLTSVTIPNSVISIGSASFYNCTGLTEITIGNSVTSIGETAFYNCTGLTEVTIPNSVTSIGDYAFYNCKGLTTVNFNAENCTTMGSSSYPVFEGCNNLKTLNIGESVKTIPDYAFRNCSGLISVTIGNSVTEISNTTFQGCSITKTIWLTNTPPNGYKNVSSKVHYVANEQYRGLSNVNVYPYISSLFETGGVRYVPVSPSERTCDAIDCLYKENVTDVKIDSTVLYRGVAMTVKEVMPYTLYNQDYIKTLSINNSGNIGNYACYDCDSINKATINNKGDIEESAFENCFTSTNNNSNELIVSNDGDIANKAFYNCSELNIATIINVGSIQNSVFADCKGLKTVSLGDSIKSIGSNAFENCTTLSEIVIPNGVISIGESAFNGCTNMTKAIVGNGVTSIGSSAFGGCASLDSIYIGRKVATVGKNAFSGCKKLPNINIPAGVTTIGDYVFSGCTSLSDVVIEDRTTALSLGSNGSSGLFADCPLDSVYIGGKITYKTSSSYGYSPFYRNTSLRTVVITDTETEIYDNEFYGCSNLTKVTIGDGVKKIGNWAFSGCSSLDHFAFGTNVESIGQEAFSDCTNVTNIRSYSAIPPVCGTQALDDINKWNCTLSVLENCQSAYQTAEQWKDFFFVNAMDKDGKVATPVITVDSVVVTISCKTAKTTIYYTTDGSEPTVESALYTGPFVVDKNCTIKAIAVRTNYYNSDVSTAQVDYFVYAESIAIDYETVSIRLNESVTLTATVLPETTANKVVVWSSSDENIATVENGIVTAHTIGEATITATTTDGTNLSATCKVTVLPILADTITLDQTNITAMEGETVVLTAKIYPEDATEKGVVWSVSDATIATIEPLDNVSAKITVLREGVATITATTIDGSNLSATCTIDVYSGIKNVQLDDTPTEYYDLSGRRVEHPTQGVYITKQGSTVRKVVVNER